MQCSPAAVAPRRQLMHGIDVTTLRSTLERPGGGYFTLASSSGSSTTPGLAVSSVLQPASPRVFSRGILAPPAAAAEEDDDSKSIPNYDLDCGDNVARRPTIDEGAHGLYLAGSWIGHCRMCPPQEQDALASTREPLLESEPTSPLSPLSIAPAEAPEDGLFRTARRPEPPPARGRR